MTQPMGIGTKYPLRRLKLPVFDVIDPMVGYFEPKGVFASMGCEQTSGFEASGRLGFYGGGTHSVVPLERGVTPFLLLHFQSSQEGNLHEQLMSLLQTSIMQEYW